jgi:hypothetical protein
MLALTTVKRSPAIVTRLAAAAACNTWQSLFLLLGLMAAPPFLPNSDAAETGVEVPAHEKIIRTYFGGWEGKDWSQIASQLAPGFTFTSPAPDDHLSIEQFKAKCWNQAEHIARFEFPKIIGDAREAFAIVQVITKDNRTIRNIEYFTFRDGKIQSIEVFFGGGGQGFPTNQK